MKDIAIYGAGGLGKEVQSLIGNINEVDKEWNLLGYFDDNKKGRYGGYPILGTTDQLNAYERPLSLVLAIGNPQQKARVFERINNRQLNYPVLIHPQAFLMETDRIELGRGVVITAGVILTCDITVGDFTLLNLNSTVGHDGNIGAFTSIMCGVNVAGNVTLGRQVFIGSGANVLNNITIGEQARVGAGAVVTKPVGSGKTAVGVPAREL